MRTTAPLAATILLAAPLFCQIPTHITPAAAANSLGGTNNSIPFSWTPTHYQQVIDKTEWSSQNPAVFNLMRLRMAAGFANRAGNSVDLEIWMGDSPNDAANASTTFANNVVPNTEVNVFPRAMVNLPMVPNNDWVIAPFPFTNQVVFVPLFHKEVRVIVWGNGNNNQLWSYPLDAWSGSGTAGSATNVGSGCRSNTGNGVATLAATVPKPGGNLQLRGTANVATTLIPMVSGIGTSNTTFGGIPLPFDLGPIGAPGCTLYNNWTLIGFSVTNGQGANTGTYDLPIPNDQSLGGAVFYSQCYFVDPPANALGVFATNGLRCVFGTGTSAGITRIYASGNPNATSGTRGVNYGLAFGFN